MTDIPDAAIEAANNVAYNRRGPQAIMPTDAWRAVLTAVRSYLVPSDDMRQAAKDLDEMLDGIIGEFGAREDEDNRIRALAQRLRQAAGE